MTQLASQRSKLFSLLRIVGKFLPGNYLKTWFYLNVVAKPRKTLRRMLTTLYRIDHVYDVLKEARRNYDGRFSILEFGTAKGYAFTKMLYATKYLGMADRVRVCAFDSFEGLRSSEDEDEGLVTDGFAEGGYKGDYEELDAYCRGHYQNYEIVRGYFEDSLTDEVLESFKTDLPILIWIDCDYYSSTKVVFERLMPFIPNGCVIYFDDYEFNYGSRLTCEARFVHELNQGLFGEDVELVLDRELSLDSNRIYRFVRAKNEARYPLRPEKHSESNIARRRSNDSPLP